MNAALETSRLDDTPSALLALLQREFDEGASREHADRSAGKLPSALRRVLLAPAQHVLARPSKELRAHLIRLAYQLAGGVAEPPAVLPHIIEILHAGSLVIDDVEDDSRERRGAPTLHRVVGPALAINTGNWLYFWALELTAELSLPTALELEVHRQFAHTMCKAHRGQALDVGVRVGELPQADCGSVARAIAELKTGALLSFAARLGAVCAEAESPQVETLARFGLALGLGLQRLDDLGSITNPRMREKGDEDLRLERVTFVWAVLAERLDACTFKRLVHQLRDDNTLAGRAALRERLERHLREHDAVSEPRRALERAVADLSEELSLSRDALARVTAHLKHLEQSYV